MFSLDLAGNLELLAQTPTLWERVSSGGVAARSLDMPNAGIRRPSIGNFDQWCHRLSMLDELDVARASLIVPRCLSGATKLAGPYEAVHVCASSSHRQV
jgi:hypothetical protein